MTSDLLYDIDKSTEVLQSGGIILYPTDTIWGIGCDATNSEAVKKIFELKKRDDRKAMLILLDEEESIKNYVSHPPEFYNIKNYLQGPLTVIFENGKGVAPELLSTDGSLAIRVVKDDFCKRLIYNFGKPIVSTSANVSGSHTPSIFKEISDEIKNGVDYIVQHRRNDTTSGKPSSIIKLKNDGTIEVIRE